MEAVLGCLSKAKVICQGSSVNRKRVASQCTRTKGTGVDAVVQGLEPLKVSYQGPGMTDE